MLRKISATVKTEQAAPKSRGVATVAYTGKAVALWLNDPSTPARQRIIELLNQIALVLDETPDYLDDPEQALAPINELLKPYIWRQNFVDKQSGRLIGFAVSASPSPVEDDELLCAKCISELAEQGLGTGIRRCRHCLRWFFTTRPKKKFWCTNECHKLWLKNDPQKKGRTPDLRTEVLPRCPVAGDWKALQEARRKAS